MRFRILTNLSEKGKNLLELPDLPKDVFFFLVILAVALGSFALGQITEERRRAKGELKLFSVGPEEAITTKSARSLVLPASSSTPPKHTLTTNGMYVGSKNGTTYHLPWCSGAQRIKEENKVWFADKLEAETMGYHPAANCKGI